MQEIFPGEKEIEEKNEEIGVGHVQRILLADEEFGIKILRKICEIKESGIPKKIYKTILKLFKIWDMQYWIWTWQFFFRVHDQETAVEMPKPIIVDVKTEADTAKVHFAGKFTALKKVLWFLRWL